MAPEPVAPPADAPIDLLVERYRACLLGERGLAAGTVRYYERIARLFLVQVSAPAGELTWSTTVGSGAAETTTTVVAGAGGLLFAGPLLMSYFVRSIRVGGLTGTSS